MTHPVDSDTIQLIPKGHPTGMDWYIRVNNGNLGGPGNYPWIEVQNGHQATLTFTLPANSGGISFPADAFCAVSVGKPNGCDTTDFSAVVKNGQLVVTDTNGVTDNYKYTITFKGAQKLDPIIKNGGGGTGFSFDSFLSTTTGEIVAAVVVLLVIALLIWAFSSRRNPADDPSDTKVR